MANDDEFLFELSNLKYDDIMNIVSGRVHDCQLKQIGVNFLHEKMPPKYIK